MNRSYKEIPLRGGPKDGHTVKVRLAEDGSGTVKTYRVYKFRGAAAAWYRYDAEGQCYRFSEVERESDYFARPR
jgi:hypothetical protein